MGRVRWCRRCAPQPPAMRCEPWRVRPATFDQLPASCFQYRHDLAATRRRRANRRLHPVALRREAFRTDYGFRRLETTCDGRFGQGRTRPQRKPRRNTAIPQASSASEEGSGTAMGVPEMTRKLVKTAVALPDCHAGPAGIGGSGTEGVVSLRMKKDTSNGLLL